MHLPIKLIWDMTSLYIANPCIWHVSHVHCAYPVACDVHITVNIPVASIVERCWVVISLVLVVTSVLRGIQILPRRI